MQENLITKTAQWAMEVVSHYVAEGDTVVDGTMGNGHDTAALARLVGPEGRVLAFDVQEQALRNTTEFLREEEIRRLTEDAREALQKILESGYVLALV